MGRMKESPRCNVISVRVSDDQLEMLKSLTTISNKSLSQLVREALSHVHLNDEVMSCAMKA